MAISEAAVSDPVVALRGVSKSFDERVAVDRLDLEVAPGICLGLLGPNGAGKTTTIRMIYGVTRPDAGSVRVFGLNVAEATRQIRSRLGVTMQESVAVEELSTRDNLRVFARYHQLDAQRCKERMQAVIELFELQSYIDVPMHQLSGGVRRRLALATSLLSDPELWILDEPTTGLDPAVRLSLWSGIRRLRDQGRTILLTTHYMDEAERLCDEVVILNEGRAICRGTPGQLIAELLSPEAVELDCSPAEEAQLTAGLEISQRIRSGQRLILFTADATPLVQRIHAFDGGERRRHTARPANLEDVFLHVTGTSLERPE